jgi:DNA-binding transcriptional MerR regulator
VIAIAPGETLDASEVDMSVDELARAAETTTRNLRALQTAGVLLSPDIVGRTAHYGTSHLSRLETVLRLQRQGFSITSIRILFEASSAGRTLEEVLGLDDAVEERRKLSRSLSTDRYANRANLRLLTDLPSTLLDEVI